MRTGHSLTPGFYDQLLTEALGQDLAELQPELQTLDRLDPEEAPQRLSRHLAALLRSALASLPGGHPTTSQLELVNQLVALLIAEVPRAVGPGDAVHTSGQSLSRIRAAPLLSGQAEALRPLIPLADSTLLVNAGGEPSVGQALIHEIPSAQQVDLLCAFIKWSGLRLLQEPLDELLRSGR